MALNIGSRETEREEAKVINQKRDQEGEELLSSR